MNANSIVRVLLERLPAPMLARAAVRRVRIGHCPGCGTCVRADDGLGLIGFRVAHAECAVLRAQRLHSGRR
jgi:hypothetical protein